MAQVPRSAASPLLLFREPTRPMGGNKSEVSGFGHEQEAPCPSAERLLKTAFIIQINGIRARAIVGSVGGAHRYSDFALRVVVRMDLENGWNDLNLFGISE